MKSARADRIMWELGEWLKTSRGKLRWRGRLMLASRAAARALRIPGETIRRFEGYYIGSGE